ncbi:flagellar protein FlaG [Agarivorans aestuarii]|uniref:Flagellar protein FlaG n=1 Tax=Agarivorans aestuarii TaxID=1563703 RepID=A0ABU7G0T0_9ALTE|nr:flagellar protein FlaG [Agarivorans aestuarii]MEE1672887.1 flagellar protein FlaG [Agarivorans aestuarii]
MSNSLNPVLASTVASAQSTTAINPSDGANLSKGDLQVERTRAENIELAQKSLNQEQKQSKEAAKERLQEDDRSSAEEVVKSINQILEVQDRDVKFIVDERDGRFFTSVLNRSTDELIREIPTEEYRRLEDRLRNFQDAIGKTTGLFVDQIV